MNATEEHSFHHFSHKHPLESTISPSAEEITCHGCRLRILSGKNYYCCKTCSFSLHKICSNMPRKTRHLGHPNHYLTLLISPPSAISTSKCEACGDIVSGFYYNCAQCGIYYHILCLSLPFSVAISLHPHTLKLEFSPPYEFSCDLCDKPSHTGWSYRCRICEFDAHISCAFSCQRTQPVPSPNTLTRQILYSSASIMEMIDYGNESEELMQLVLQGFSRRNPDRNGPEFACNTAVAGWDERLRSPIRKHIDHQTEIQTSGNSTTSSLDGPRNKDLSAPISEDLTIQSYQFSDLCFSIDLLKSYSIQDHKVQTSKEARNIEIERVGIPEDEANINSDVAKIIQKASDNSWKVENQPDCHKNPVINHLYKDPENWLNEESSSGRKSGLGRPIEQDIIKLKKTNSIFSCWRRLFGCFYHQSYQKCSKSFKNGGQ